MRYGSVCSGVEVATLAWHHLGWKPVFFSEVEPFPCAVLQERLGASAPINPLAPEEATSEDDRKMRESWIKQNNLLKKEGIIPNEGDFTKIGNKYAGKIDLLVGGTPCFVAGTMVLTPKGYVPIETLKVGDSVISGEGIERKVEAVGNKISYVGNIKILGRPEITCTANHPFMCFDVKRDNRRKSSTYANMIPCSDYYKVRADEAVGKYVGRIKIASVNTPAFPVVYDATKEQIMELAGWYLGDGYIRRWHDKNKKAVVFCLCNKNKIDTFEEHFGDSINYSVGADGKITVNCTEFANWLSENFGELSENKRIPYWCYGVDEKYALLRGYRCTDGCEQENEYKFTTVSKALAYGMADLMGDASVSFRVTPDTAVIDGRTINQKDCYYVHFYKNKTIRTKNFNGRYASKIRSFINAGIDTVYNITVAEDHTYIANGIYTHNCQDLSIAGKRAGFEGERSSLAIDFVRLAYESKCKWVVWENVPGVFSSNGGRDFATFLSLLSGAEVEVPVNGWGTAGFVCNARPDRYGLSWRTLDGQFTRTSRFPFAVPQRRRRVFVVGYFGDWTRAAEVLLEPERLYWDTPTRFKARERITGIIEKSTGTAGTNNAVNFASSSFGNYSETDFWGTLKSSGGDLAGGSENLSVFWNGNDFAETLKTNCNSDRMPDKGKLNCVIERNDVAATLTASYADKMGIENQHVDSGCPNFVVGYNGAGDSSGDVTPTLQANLGKLLSNQTPIICKADGFMARAGAESDIVYQKECSPTVRATMEPCILLNDQGGSVMQVEEDGNAGTLRANSHGNEQIVCAGFLGTQGSKARGIGYSEEHSPTLRAGAEIDLLKVDSCSTLKIRSGCEGGGKGALIQDELSATLGCGNDQTLFCVHGAQTPIFNTEHANALGCNNNGLENCVMSLNSKQFNAMEKELASTLLSTDYKEPQVVCYENHANDSRVTEMGECCQSLTSRAGTGGGNLPLVQECYEWHSQDLRAKKINDGCGSTISA